MVKDNNWTPILVAVTGSRAYGLHHEGSDWDRHSLAVAPTEEFLGFSPPLGRRATQVKHDPDMTVHEIGKATALMLGCNPTMLDLLWLPQDCYEVRTEYMEELIFLRDEVLSAPAVRNSFMGYATQQLRRMGGEGDPEEGSVKWKSPTHRVRKNARHVMRLLRQGYELYSTGTMDIRVKSPEEYFAFAERAAQDPRLAEDLIKEYKDKFNECETPLPGEPHQDRLENWLRWVRLEMLAS